MKRVAFFDFDGTITSKDSFLELIKYIKGKTRFYTGFAVLSPVLMAYKAGLIPNWRAKEIVLAYFFKGMPADEFQKACDAFGREVIPAMVRSKALEQLEAFKKDNTRIIVVTASAEQWVSSWCREQGLELLATRLEAKENKITGRLLGYNCYGKEKVERINRHLSLGDYQEVYAFGDTRGDLEMLKLASYAYYKPFCS